jgi:site-specific DNA recombinase
MTGARAAPKRCAIYTRKSSEEGLEQDFNSLQAQREACEAFIKSQAGEGWQPIKTAYDDGGFSGGTMERPALQQLLAHIRERRVDTIVVYKVDRLTRSLADFAKMVELFDAHGVSFVAVTQQFNTTTSMGRLTLNVLLSFAQFEREVTGERIRDKIAASKQKGMWMGGITPLGYDVHQRQLIINQAEAATVRLIYQLYLRLGSVRLLKAELDRRGLVSKVRVSKTRVRSGGCRFGRGALYEMLANPIYIGQIRHRQLVHPGQHPPILERTVWERVQRKLREQAARTGGRGTKTATSPLAGKLFDANGEPLYVCGAVKGMRRYRYYVSRKLVRGGPDSSDRGWRLAAPELEKTVDAAVRRLLSDPAALSRAVRHSRMSAEELQQLLSAAARHATLIDDCAAETLTALLDRVELRTDGMELTLDLRSLRLSQESAGTPTTNLKITQLIPLQMKRRGVETRLVIPGAIASTTARTDPALLRVVARAHCWFNQLASGAVTSTRQIAHREQLSHSYVRHALPLGLLAPSIVEAICTGRQAVALTAERLKNHRQLSLEWTAQQQQLSH